MVPGIGHNTKEEVGLQTEFRITHPSHPEQSEANQMLKQGDIDTSIIRHACEDKPVP